MSSLGNNLSFGGASLGNVNGVNVSGEASTIQPPFTNELNPVNKAYTDAADSVLQSQITATQGDVDGFPDELKNLSGDEITQLENIGTTTITPTQWSYVGTADQPLGTTDNATFADLNVANVFPTGTVDGRDVSADGSNLDNLNTTIGLNRLTYDEVTQLTNINTNTISGTQWGYVGNANQNVRTTDTVTFDRINSTEKFVGTGLDIQNNGAFSQISPNGLCIKTGGAITDTSSCLIHVLAGGTTFESTTGQGLGVLNATINPAGVTVSSGKDFIISGGATLSGVNTQVSTNTGNISTNSGNISTNSGSISTNAGNITTNSNAIANKPDGKTSVAEQVIIGTPSAITGANRGVYIAQASTLPTISNGTHDNVLIQGAKGVEAMKVSGQDNVVIGAKFEQNFTYASQNTILGTKHAVEQSNSFAGVVVGYENTQNSADNTGQIIIGHTLMSRNKNQVLIGNSIDNSSENGVAVGQNQSDTSGGSNNISIGFATVILPDALNFINFGNTVIGNNSQATGGGTVVGSDNLIYGKNSVVGNSNNAFQVGINNTHIFGHNNTATTSDTYLLGNNLDATGQTGFLMSTVYDTAASGASLVVQTLGAGLSRIGSIVSSRRHKEEIQPLNETDFDSADIYKVQPVKFKYKEKEGYHCGVIAESMLEHNSNLLRNLVIWGDEEGVDESEPRNINGMTVKSFNYMGLICPMIAEMKKLRDDIEYLKQENDSLKTICSNLVSIIN